MEGQHLKHVRRLSLAELEAVAVELARIGAERGKACVVVVKRRAGCGTPTPRLVVMTERVYASLVLGTGADRNT